MINFSYIDVSSIHADVPRSEFSEAEIDHLADIILECGGILKPIFLQQMDLENFKVIEGNLEYYAAVRAKEKDLRQGEMINAIIVPAEQAKSMQKQLDFFNQLDTVTSNIPQTNDIRTEEKLKASEAEQKKQITPLEKINTYEQAELFKLLKQREIKKADKLAEAICKVRDNKTNGFTDFTDVYNSVKSLKIKGLLGEKTMLSIIDALSNT